jgi:hypothetical protein
MPSIPEAREDDPKLDLAAEILRRCGTVQLKAWGTSMLPSVWPGDLLTIQSVAYDQVVRGDILLVLRDNRFFIHRLVETRLREDCISWITRGDAMPQSDPPASASQMLGRVVGIRRANRTLVPSRQLSLLNSGLAWTLCRWNKFRNLTLRIRGARTSVGSMRAGKFFRGVFRAVCEIPMPFHRVILTNDDNRRHDH